MYQRCVSIWINKQLFFIRTLMSNNLDLLADLNAKQQQAVSFSGKHLVVLAGAGSGKTRVLVHRIAWLIQKQQCSPNAILAVTFTNKAAQEMKQRIWQVTQHSTHQLWVGTFHGIGHRLLRTHYLEAGLPQNFQILDSDDQLRLVKRIIGLLKLDEKRWAPKQAVWFINQKKDEGLRAAECQAQHIADKTWLQIYQLYQDACDRSGLVDFAEILLRTYEMFCQHPPLLSHYRACFNYILVDEFQDTNHIQYQWIKLLAGSHAHVMIVGDDDQSIYGWRGAQSDNIQKFIDDFNPVEVIRLEQNYRSTEYILKAANAVIANNTGRLGKNLWTSLGQGEPIQLYSAFNDIEEARYVVGKIDSLHRDNKTTLNQCAILYRSNAQSRILEESLIQSGLPYRIYGGTRFFDRQEIKDAVAYLRLLSNCHDDAAFERVINTPARGIGDRTLDIIRQQAKEGSLTLWQAAVELLENNVLTGRAANAVLRFMELINVMKQEFVAQPLDVQTERMIVESGLRLMYEQERGEKAQARLENLDELVTAAKQYAMMEQEQQLAAPEMLLQNFLSHVSLESGETQADSHQDSVQLMTLHSAKGLEFENVFIVGMEDGMFPSQMAIMERDGLEEERRLAYVGITRAMKRLFLTRAENRRIFGREMRHPSSRFLKEIPRDCLQEVRIGHSIYHSPSSQSTFSQRKRAYDHTTSSTASQTFKANSSSDGLYQLGQRVFHTKFGEGTIINIEGSGEHTRLQVAFAANEGIKWLVAKFARLEVR